MLLLLPVSAFTACVPHCAGIAAVGGGSGENLCSGACVSGMVRSSEPDSLHSSDSPLNTHPLCALNKRLSWRERSGRENMCFYHKISALVFEGRLQREEGAVLCSCRDVAGWEPEQWAGC